MNFVMKAVVPLVVFAGTIGFAAPGQATIVGAVGGEITSGGPGFGTLDVTFNQAGLFTRDQDGRVIPAVYVSGVTDFDSFVATTFHIDVFQDIAPPFDIFEWFSDFGTAVASVTYDLGALLSIDRLALWNEDGAGIGLLDLLFSVNGTDFSPLASGLGPTDNTFEQFYGADVFSFAATEMRFLRMDMADCPQTDNGFLACGIGEVAFGLAAVPEPAPIPVPAAGLLLVSALGGLGVMRRRKRG